MALWDLLGQGARRAGLAAARLRAAHTEAALCLAAVRRHAGRRRWRKARQARAQGFRAVKFGWGPFGRGTCAEDRRPVRRGARRPRAGRHAARRCRADLGRGCRRAPLRGCRRLKRSARSGSRSRSTPARSTPMRALAARSAKVKLAGGEGAHNVHMARHLIDYGGVGFVQIDCRPHRRHRPGQAGRRLRGRAGRHLCEPHLHLASRAERLAAALCGARRSSHLRISGRAEAARLRHDTQPSRRRTQRRDRACPTRRASASTINPEAIRKISGRRRDQGVGGTLFETSATA